MQKIEGCTASMSAAEMNAAARHAGYPASKGAPSCGSRKLSAE